MVGNAAVARLINARGQPPGAPPIHVQRAPEPRLGQMANPRAAAAMSEQMGLLERGITDAEGSDPELAARLERALLLLQFTHADDLADEAAVVAYVAVCKTNAEKESVTITKLGADAEQVMIQNPQAFPSSWADILAKTLDLGLDVAGVAAERQRSWENLGQVGARVPHEVTEYGLPVSLAEIGGLKSFELKPQHATLGDPDVVRDFAQAALGYRASAMRAELVRWWTKILKGLVESVRSGDETVDPAELAKIKGTYGRVKEFASTGALPGEDQFRALDADVANLHELIMLTAILSYASGLHQSGELWQEAADLFKAKLGEADAIVARWGMIETLKHAFLWMIDRDYVSDQLLLMVHVLVDNIGDIMEKLLLFMGLQAIPIVDIIVDAYLGVEMGVDLAKALWDLGSAFIDASSADRVLSLQKGSAHLTSALLTAPLRIALDYFGLSATLAQLEARVTRLLAESPAMSPQQAAKLAIKESEGGGSGSTGKVDEPTRVKGQTQEPVKPKSKPPKSPSKLTAGEISDGVRLAKSLPGGGRLKLLEDGRLIVCHSPCQSIAARFDTELAQVSPEADGFRTRLQTISRDEQAAVANGDAAAELDAFNRADALNTELETFRVERIRTATGVPEGQLRDLIRLAADDGNMVERLLGRVGNRPARVRPLLEAARGDLNVLAKLENALDEFPAARIPSGGMVHDPAFGPYADRANMAHFIERHTYDGFDFQQIKVENTFFPPGTSAADIQDGIERALAALKRRGDSFPSNFAKPVNIEGGPLGAMLVQITRDGGEVVQFFPLQAGRADVVNFTREEMTGIGWFLGRLP